MQSTGGPSPTPPPSGLQFFFFFTNFMFKSIAHNFCCILIANQFVFFKHTFEEHKSLKVDISSFFTNDCNQVDRDRDSLNSHTFVLPDRRVTVLADSFGSQSLQADLVFV